MSSDRQAEEPLHYFAGEGAKIVYRGGSAVSEPRVTIGLPTYKRAPTLRRALSSIAKQTFRNFVVVISDNGGEDPETISAVREFADLIPEVVLLAQETNQGMLASMYGLLLASTTPYFMWLADDDEISPNYLEELVGLLESDPWATSAAGAWNSKELNGLKEGRKQLMNSSSTRWIRVFRHVALSNEDSAFYGLHRTAVARRTHFPGYVYPNRGVLTNFCYVFLFEMALAGKLVHSKDASWTAYNDVPKAYVKARAGGLANKVKTMHRRLNLYAIYVSKTARLSPLLLPIVLVASVVGLAGDVGGAIFRIGLRRFSGTLSR